MKEVINLQGELELVPNTTPVKTKDGVHYLLSEADEQEVEAQHLEWLSNADVRQKNKLRRIREPLLKEADIQIFKHEDLSLDPTEWRQYRISLRDVPEQLDIYNPVWPTKPVSV